MAIRTIRLFGDPVLQMKCADITEITDGVRQHVCDLLETVNMPGHAGVASNQIGHRMRAFSLNVDGCVQYVLNPVLQVDGEPVPRIEGCLSVPDLSFSVLRHPFAQVTGIDLDGNSVKIAGSGLLAQALQHECDHLDGKLYIHRLSREDRAEAFRQIRHSTWFSR